MSHEEIIKDTHTKVTQMHTVLFGTENQGGVLREIDSIKKTVDTHDKFLWKAAGAGVALIFFVNLIVTLISKLL